MLDSNPTDGTITVESRDTEPQTSSATSTCPGEPVQVAGEVEQLLHKLLTWHTTHNTNPYKESRVQQSGIFSKLLKDLRPYMFLNLNFKGAYPEKDLPRLLDDLFKHHRSQAKDSPNISVDWNRQFLERIQGWLTLNDEYKEYSVGLTFKF